MKPIKKEITFFYNEGVEKNHWENLVLEANKRGYLTTFSNNMKDKAEIGFYCSDENKPENSKLSLVMLHGMDQGRTRWPNIWRDWPWHKFDVGLLPGKTWSDRWKSVAQDPYAHPKVAVCEVGSPKADEIFKEINKFQMKVADLFESLNLPFDKTVLYAPSFETDGKQEDIVKLLQATKTNLLIKHWLISNEDKKRFPDVWENITKACSQISKKQKNISILSPELGIMTCLGLCDVLVTDESSVAYEALLLNKKVFTFKEWVMRTNNVESPRPVNPPKDIVNIVSREKFKELITSYKKNSDLSETTKKRDNLFSHLGESSEKIIDIVDAIINNLEIENVIVSDKKIKKWLLPVRFILRKISKLMPKKLRHRIRNMAIRKKFMGSYFGEAS